MARKEMEIQVSNEPEMELKLAMMVRIILPMRPIDRMKMALMKKTPAFSLICKIMASDHPSLSRALRIFGIVIILIMVIIVIIVGLNLEVVEMAGDREGPQGWINILISPLSSQLQELFPGELERTEQQKDDADKDEKKD